MVPLAYSPEAMLLIGLIALVCIAAPNMPRRGFRVGLENGSISSVGELVVVEVALPPIVEELVLVAEVPLVTTE